MKAQKNDDRDAEAIAEAATRPTMRFVELKSAEQLDMQVLHRARDRLIAERTALINQLRAVLMERGITVPQGRRKLEQALTSMLEGCETALSPRVRALINDMREEWCALDHRICAFDNEFAARAREDERARRLTTIPGIGVLSATALVAAIGDGQSFARGRDLAAWLGLRSTACDHGRQAAPQRNQQAWQCLSTEAPDPRLPCRIGFALQERDCAWQLVTRLTDAGACEHRRGGTRQQAARIAWAILRTGHSFEAKRVAVG